MSRHVPEHGSTPLFPVVFCIYLLNLTFNTARVLKKKKNSAELCMNFVLLINENSLISTKTSVVAL